MLKKVQIFQSTSSVWRTTLCPALPGGARLISIHVLRVEDDLMSGQQVLGIDDFNPRPPCGGRPFAVSFAPLPV